VSGRRSRVCTPALFQKTSTTTRLQRPSIQRVAHRLDFDALRWDLPPYRMERSDHKNRRTLEAARAQIGQRLIGLP
jgi:hypothetical protein